MPMGKGTYYSQVGRPKKKKTILSAKQKTLPPTLKRKSLKSKSKNA